MFDHNAFETGLKPILEKALAGGKTKGLVKFIEQNLEALKNPDDGEPLGEDWKDSIDPDDPQACGAGEGPRGLREGGGAVQGQTAVSQEP